MQSPCLSIEDHRIHKHSEASRGQSGRLLRRQFICQKFVCRTRKQTGIWHGCSETAHCSHAIRSQQTTKPHFYICGIAGPAIHDADLPLVRSISVPADMRLHSSCCAKLVNCVTCDIFNRQLAPYTSVVTLAGRSPPRSSVCQRFTGMDFELALCWPWDNVSCPDLYLPAFTSQSHIPCLCNLQRIQDVREPDAFALDMLRCKR